MFPPRAYSGPHNVDFYEFRRSECTCRRNRCANFGVEIFKGSKIAGSNAAFPIGNANHTYNCASITAITRQRDSATAASQ